MKPAGNKRANGVGCGQSFQEAQWELLRAQPSLRAAELDDARREALRAKRTTLSELLSGGVLSEQTYSELVGEVDAALTEDHHAAADSADADVTTAGPAEALAERETGQ